MKLKPMGAMTAVAAILAFSAWHVTQGREEAAESKPEPTAQAPASPGKAGEQVVVLDQAADMKSGVTAAPLQPISYHRQVQAYGVVLPLQGLIDLRNSIETARSQREKAAAILETSRREYERLKVLHADDRNVSDKALQAAEAAWKTDEANVRAARAGLNAIEQNARQQWGGMLAKAVSDGSALFNRLVEQREVLLQITAPSEVHIPQLPRTAGIRLADETSGTATLISSSPRTDPHLQGASYFYSSAAPNLLPGMNVTAYLPYGEKTQGVVIPASAVVWWQGKAWIYVQEGAQHYARQEIPTDNPIEDGWFASKEFKAGEKIVVTGAQMLLSQEFRSQIQSGEEGESSEKSEAGEKGKKE